MADCEASSSVEPSVPVESDTSMELNQDATTSESVSVPDRAESESPKLMETTVDIKEEPSDNGLDEDVDEDDDDDDFCIDSPTRPITEAPPDRWIELTNNFYFNRKLGIAEKTEDFEGYKDFVEELKEFHLAQEALGGGILSIAKTILFGRPKEKLVQKTMGKPRKWVRKTFFRSDGMSIEKWQRESDQFNLALSVRPVDPKITLMNSFTNDEYELFLKSDKWTLNETRLLCELLKKYHFKWSVLADRFLFDGRRKTLLQIKARVHTVYNGIHYSRHGTKGSEYNPKADIHNFRVLHLYYQRNRASYEREQHVQNTLKGFSVTNLEKRSLDLSQSALIQKAAAIGATSVRSSSSCPPSRLPSVPKNLSRQNAADIIDYNKRLEAARDTTALRYFNRETLGPHFRSQEFKLQSNVTPKKKANIDSVIDSLRIHINEPTTVYNSIIVESLTTLSTNINVLTELKNLFNIALQEYTALHTEWKEKTGSKESMQEPTYPRPEGNRPTICSFIVTQGPVRSHDWVARGLRATRLQGQRKQR